MTDTFPDSRGLHDEVHNREVIKGCVGRERLEPYRLDLSSVIDEWDTVSPEAWERLMRISYAGPGVKIKATIR